MPILLPRLSLNPIYHRFRPLCNTFLPFCLVLLQMYISKSHFCILRFQVCNRRTCRGDCKIARPYTTRTRSASFLYLIFSSASRRTSAAPLSRRAEECGVKQETPLRDLTFYVMVVLSGSIVAHGRDRAPVPIVYSGKKEMFPWQKSERPSAACCR